MKEKNNGRRVKKGEVCDRENDVPGQNDFLFPAGRIAVETCALNQDFHGDREDLVGGITKM